MHDKVEMKDIYFYFFFSFSMKPSVSTPSSENFDKIVMVLKKVSFCQVSIFPCSFGALFHQF